MQESKWALVLGASSGFGAATAKALAKAGHNIAGVHLDRRSAQGRIDALSEEIQGYGQKLLLFNTNAADDTKRQEVITALQEQLQPGQLKVLLHSIAFGSLVPLAAGSGKLASRAQLEMTLDVMGTSLVYWTQDIIRTGLMGEGGRIFAMTSEGSKMVWPGYGPVSAAKCVLEAYVRQLAMELAPKKITVNAMMAGTTLTPALEKIPGSEKLVEKSLARNPSGRLTVPEDVADCIVALLNEKTRWLTGNVLQVDGGESLTG
jgi:NAD(P)-dependent dehydrogenase (short-subunit alcohol dehydrogenase family)